MKNSCLIVNLCVELWAEAANPIILETQILFSLFRNLDMAERAVKVMRASVSLRALCGAHTLASGALRWDHGVCIHQLLALERPLKTVKSNSFTLQGEVELREEKSCAITEAWVWTISLSLFFCGSEQRNFIWLNYFLQIVLQLNVTATQTVCYFICFVKSAHTFLFSRRMKAHKRWRVWPYKWRLSLASFQILWLRIYEWQLTRWTARLPAVQKAQEESQWGPETWVFSETESSQAFCFMLVL